MMSRRRTFIPGLALVTAIGLAAASCSSSNVDPGGGTGGTAKGGGPGSSGGSPGSGTGGGSGGSPLGGAGGVAGRAGTGGRAGAGGRAMGGHGGGATGGGAGTGGGATGTGGTAGAGGAAAEPFKGVANSPCAARQALKVSWYYNWEQTETEPCSDGSGGVFVPMVWGHTGSEQSSSGIMSAVASFVGKHQPYVMGFNEPDNSSQSNIPVATAISLWPSFLNPSIQVVSPATQANTTGQTWFSSFMDQVNSASLRVDVVGIHWYGWNSGSCESNASTLESYIKGIEKITGDRPIWITEWGCLHDSAPDTQTVVKFFQGAITMFAKHPRIRRYAWYPWSTNNELNNSDGSLTDLGKVFASEPATH
jgi:hypothetical protein